MAGAAAPTETLRARVEQWMEQDPARGARGGRGALVAHDAGAGLGGRCAHGLTSAPGGLRGRPGAGPSRMNVATVRAASAGLAPPLLDAVAGARDAGVVIGHDARHGS